MRKTNLIILTIFIFTIGRSQSIICPLKEGFIYKNRYKIGIRADMEKSRTSIFSKKNNSVFCIFEGVVFKVLKVDYIYSIIIKSNNKYIAYSNLSSILVKENDFISLNTVLGTALKNDELGLFELHIMEIKNNELYPISDLPLCEVCNLADD